MAETGMNMPLTRLRRGYNVPTGTAIEESVDLAYEIFNRVFRRVADKLG